MVTYDTARQGTDAARQETGAARIAELETTNRAAQEPAKRLIVFIPDGLTDNLGLARKIYWMAMQARSDVLFLTLIDRPENALAASRCMATMKAITSTSGIDVQVHPTPTRDWVTAVEEIYRPGDRIICHAEQLVRLRFMQTQTVKEYLADRLGVPVETISGFCRTEKVWIETRLRALLFWLGCIVILAGFSILEVQVDLGMHGPARTAALLMAFLLECGAVIAWSGLGKGPLGR